MQQIMAVNTFRASGSSPAPLQPLRGVRHRVLKIHIQFAASRATGFLCPGQCGDGASRQAAQTGVTQCSFAAECKRAAVPDRPAR